MEALFPQKKALESECHHFLHTLFNPSDSDFFIVDMRVRLDWTLQDK